MPRQNSLKSRIRNFGDNFVDSVTLPELEFHTGHVQQVLNNVFESDAAITLLLFKIEKEYWSIMKSFLIYLNMLEKHELKDVRSDENVFEILRKI